MSTRECFAETALRIRVIMSEIGSVIYLLSEVSSWRQAVGGSAPPSPPSLLSLPTALCLLPSRCYQALFVTPVTSPSSARFRKQRRHIANFRMYARGRPHSWHRLRKRILYFGALASFA